MTEEEAKVKIAEICNVSRETMDKLDRYGDLLEQWNPKINLVSKTTLPQKWVRHFLDSAQIWPYIPKDTQYLTDIGSGAGFAGLVIAAIAAEKIPHMTVTLVESDARKCAFMRTASREMGVTPIIQTQRIEMTGSNDAQVLTARALAPISDLLTFSEGILAKNGVCLFLKGEACAKEIENAKESWCFESETYQSMTHEGGVVVKLAGIERGGKG